MNNVPVTAEDLYLYAMGLLDESEQTRLDAFLKQSPEARAELINVRSDIGLLALSVEVVAPAPSARMRLLNEIAREPKATAVVVPEVTTPVVEAVVAESSSNVVTMTPVPAVVSEQTSESIRRTDAPLAFRSSYAESAARERSMMATVSPWLGWAIAAGLAVTAWDFYQKSEVLTNQVSVATAKADSAAASSAKAVAVLDAMRSSSAQRFVLTRQNVQPVPSARVTYLAESGSLVFQGSNMDALPEDKTYELWLIPADKGGKPIPAGTFKPDTRGFASLIMPELPRGVVAGTFGVTMEDDGGAQTPTMPILMIGS